MKHRPSSWLLRSLSFLLLLCVPANLLEAQAYVPTPEELEQLLAPVALYPDALLAQITSASTNPQEILDVNAWLQQNSGLSGPPLVEAAQRQGFDPPFVALVNFPQVIGMMAQNIDDYAAIGAAFEADQASVMDAVQNLREDAYQAGALESGPQQRVVVENENGQSIILIEPANPQVVYIPRYDPGVVFGYGHPGAAGWIAFGAGISIGIALAASHPWGWSHWGWNWRQRRLLYHQALWRPNLNHYRPPRPAYRPHRPNFGNRPALRPPRPGPGRPAPGRPAPGRPATGRPNPGASRPPSGARPGTRPGARPTPGNPSVQPVRPAPNRPGPNRPTPGRPATRPAPKPQTRPAPVRPAPGRPAPERPAPQPGRPAAGRPAAPPPRPENGSRPSRPAGGQQRPQQRPGPKEKPQPQ